MKLGQNSKNFVQSLKIWLKFQNFIIWYGLVWFGMVWSGLEGSKSTTISQSVSDEGGHRADRAAKK